MKNYIFYGWGRIASPMLKYLVIMKLIVLIVFVAVIQVNASSYAQTITLSQKDISLVDLFREIKKQTGYNVLCNTKLIKETPAIKVNLKNTALKAALDLVLIPNGLNYTIENKTIVVQRIASFSNEAVWRVEIKGKVVDHNDKPMPGVSVKLKGSSTGTITDAEGNFTIRNAKSTDILVFSYLGYETSERTIGSQKNIKVIMVDQAASLNEVVVVGYGTVNRSDLTGSVGEVKMDDLKKAPVATFEQALAGRIAGVQVSSNDGQPGSTMNIVIRGGNSLTQQNSPLYVVDGFPMEESVSSILNPSDIESINILKDASATAIYGARGANGVIIIETKKGKIGKPVVGYDGSLGFNNVTRKMDLMNPYEFVRYQLEINPAIAENAYLTVPGRTLDDYKTTPAIDWQDKMFETGSVQIHNLSLTGGNADTKYAVSGSIFDQKGVVVNSGYNRYQGRILLEQRISNKVKASFNINVGNETNFGVSPSSSRSSSSQPYSTFLMYQVWGARPVNTGLNIEDELLDPDANDARFNPYISALNEVRTRTTNTLLANAKISYVISKKFELTVRGGINNNSIRSEEFYNAQTSRGYPFPDNNLGVNGSTYNAETNSWLNENLLTYDHKINKNNKINVIGGFTLQKVLNRRSGYLAKNVPNPDLGVSGIDEGELSSLASSLSDFTQVSFLGRVNYSYKSKYLFTASMRADASSKFSENNRWGYFPSAAFAWNMLQESFMKKLPFVSNSKLRLSYGITGNNRVGDFSYLSSVTFPYGSYYSFNNQTPQQGALLSNYGNYDLKWESTAQTDIGYDLSLLKNRISLTVDLYRKVTSDLLLNANVPYSTGYTKILKNVGKVKNQGIELTLNTVNIKTKNFEWSSDFNIAFNSNKILALADDQESMISTVGFPAPFSAAQLYLAKVGGPAAVFYGYKWLGNYQVEDFDQQPNGSYLLKPEISGNGSARGNIKPGDIKYDDINGDGIVNEKDRVIIGRALPKHIGGFNNNFNYKGLALNVFFQWSYGNDIFNANRDMFEGNAFTRSNLNQYASYVNRWTPENQNNEYYRFGGQGPAGRFSSRTIEDGTFLRLKTVSLSYSLPSAFISKLKIKSVNVFATGQNLYTWTKYSGMDPEVSVANTILTPGFDYSAYPRERTLVFGIKASL
ncbi:TonB-linked outer membrane protein, SusC/RagA family [Pedobacter sp. ok626]|nr:TonB-linked outer membrane protein, SusC/RagA family [Pedobacter sp. ok626]